MMNMFDNETIRHYKYFNPIICGEVLKSPVSSDSIELDFHIAQSVAYLNRKGYNTYSCCEGHMNMDVLKKGYSVEIRIGFCQNCVPSTAPDGFEYVRYKTGLWTLHKIVVPDNRYKCLTASGNKCHYKGAIKLTNEEYDKCVNFLLDSYAILEDWASKVPRKP